MFDSRRRLPHWQPDGRALFLTWHLHGSLPRARYPPPGHPSAGQAFVWMDRYLDTTRVGPYYLRQAAIAQVVVDAIRYGETELRLFETIAYVVMSNHVHLLVTPNSPASQFARSVKGFSARQANKLLHRSGPFWQAESYDRWVRDDRELVKIANYIHQNPVKAGLVHQPEDYRWSTAWSGK